MPANCGRRAARRALPLAALLVAAAAAAAAAADPGAGAAQTAAGPADPPSLAERVAAFVAAEKAAGRWPPGLLPAGAAAARRGGPSWKGGGWEMRWCAGVIGQACAAGPSAGEAVGASGAQATPAAHTHALRCAAPPGGALPVVMSAAAAAAAPAAGASVAPQAQAPPASLRSPQLPAPGPATEADVSKTNFGMSWVSAQAAPAGGVLTCFDLTTMPLYGGKECEPGGNATCCTTGTSSRNVAVRELLLYPSG
jgi:hypothetical protein